MSITTYPQHSNNTRDQYNYMENDDSPDNSSKESTQGQNIENRIKSLKLKIPVVGGSMIEPVRSASEIVPNEYGTFSDINFQKFNTFDAR